MRRLVAALLACAFLGGAGCGGQPLLVHRVENAPIFIAYFVDTHDTLLVHQSDHRFRDEVRFFAADGQLISEGEVGGYWPPGTFLLADQYHLIVPSGARGDGRYVLAPEASTPSATARAALSWIAGAGGLLREGQAPSAATNPYADLSCAVGADGSVAVWSTSAGDFRSSRPRLVGDRHTVSLGVRCLRDGGGDFVVALGAKDGVALVRVFSVDRQELVAELPLSHQERFRALPTNTSHVSANAIAGISDAANYELDPALRPFIATRISIESGRWAVENALLAEDWPAMRSVRFLSVERNNIVLSVDGMTHAVRVRWPNGVSEIAFVPQAVAHREDAFHTAVLRANTPQISPSGSRVLWLNRTGELRIEDAEEANIGR